MARTRLTKKKNPIPSEKQVDETARQPGAKPGTKKKAGGDFPKLFSSPPSAVGKSAASADPAKEEIKGASKWANEAASADVAKQESEGTGAWAKDADAAETVKKQKKVGVMLAAKAQVGDKECGVYSTVKSIDGDNSGLFTVVSVRKDLGQHVRSLAERVDDDWHDSLEDTERELLEYMNKCCDYASDALSNIVTQDPPAFEVCHEVLNIIAETWDDIKHIPFRCDPDDQLSSARTQLLIERNDDDLKAFDAPSPSSLLQIAWPLLLVHAAYMPDDDASKVSEAVSDEVLLHIIKDAVDAGLKKPHAASEQEQTCGFFSPSESDEQEKRGRQRLRELFASRRWAGLPSTKVKHIMRRCIDRRYDGDEDRRTRDYHCERYDDGSPLGSGEESISWDEDDSDELPG